MSEPTEWIERRLANAQLAGAKANAVAKSALGGVQLGLLQKAMGGLWVGGTAYLTETTVEFHPNLLNRLTHAKGSIEPVVLPLTAITDVKFRKGLGTNIVDIATDAGSVSIRAYNMAAFAEAICDAADAVQGRR